VKLQRFGRTPTFYSSISVRTEGHQEEAPDERRRDEQVGVVELEILLGVEGHSVENFVDPGFEYRRGRHQRGFGGQRENGQQFLNHFFKFHIFVFDQIYVSRKD
jgi:hypothetical protein